MNGYDAVLFYDMSGIAFPGDGSGLPPGAGLEPPDDYVPSTEALLDGGTGIVLLKYALLSWPAWPPWREISQTSFLLRGGELEGHSVPASGYRGGGTEPERNAHMHLSAATPGHPVLEGLDGGFAIVDEAYLKTPGFESRVLPLLRAGYSFSAEHFSPSPLASREEQATWQHPPGSDLVVWANVAGSSPILASELGDGPDACGNPAFRRLVGNAVRWVASAEARTWAKSFTPTDP